MRETSGPATSATDTLLLLRAFVDELVRSGMRAACTAPGSRCAPLVLSLAREPRLRCYSHVDERCAGFFALGLAKASGLPVAVACTSGTAAAELLPAAIEAREARVPLLLLTADRPPELREVGAGQAIDQLKIYGDAAKWFFEVGCHEAGPQRLRWMRALACRAYARTLEGRPGVVHLNFPLREPLVTNDPLPHDGTARREGVPFLARISRRAGGVGDSSGSGEAAQAGEGLHVLRELLGGSRRGVVVAGRDERRPGSGGRGMAQAAAAFAAGASWPLLADPLSGARRGDAAIAHYDALLRSGTFTAQAEPDLIVRLGDLPVSKPLRTWLAERYQTPQVAFDPEGAFQDPVASLSYSLALDPALGLAALEGAAPAPADGWFESWQSADELAAEAIRGELAGGELSEPVVAAELGVLLPDYATLFVASSMPVRDIETFWPARPDPPRVLCNRGANGIDGTVSSAFGAAAEADGPVVLLIGDVALAHDIGGLLAARRMRLKLTIVLLDNGGGGIFDFLPVARTSMARRPNPREPDADDDIYTRHVATPTGLDFASAAGLYGLGYERVEDVRSFREALESALALEGSSLIAVPGNREANVALHERIWQAACAAISPPAAGAAPTA